MNSASIVTIRLIGITTISVVEVLGLVNVWALSYPISIILDTHIYIVIYIYNIYIYININV